MVDKEGYLAFLESASGEPTAEPDKVCNPVEKITSWRGEGPVNPSNDDGLDDLIKKITENMSNKEGEMPIGSVTKKEEETEDGVKETEDDEEDEEEDEEDEEDDEEDSSTTLGESDYSAISMLEGDEFSMPEEESSVLRRLIQEMEEAELAAERGSDLNEFMDNTDTGSDDSDELPLIEGYEILDDLDLDIDDDLLSDL